MAISKIHEEWDPKRGFIHPNEIKAEKEKKAAEIKAKIASGQIKVRNLDEKPLKRAPLKQDTEYSVGEIAKKLYDADVKLGGVHLQGKFESAKDFESTLRNSKSLRIKADAFMVKKYGKKAKKEEKKEAPMGDLIKRAFDSKNPAVKDLVKDFQNPTALRNALTKNTGWKNQLEKLLGNLNEGYKYKNKDLEDDSFYMPDEKDDLSAELYDDDKESSKKRGQAAINPIKDYQISKTQFNSIINSYRENKGTDFGDGIKWTMEELFGQKWKNIN